MSSYPLLTASSPSPYYGGGDHYTSLYNSGSHRSSLADALREPYSTPRIAASLVVRPQPPSLYIPPIASRRVPLSFYPPSAGAISRTVPSSDSESTGSGSESPYSVSAIGEPSYVLESSGLMLPGAVVPTSSSEDLWGPSYSSGSPPRRRHNTAPEILNDTSYGLYGSYGVPGSISQTSVSVSPTDVTAPRSPVYNIKPESPESVSLSFPAYHSYTSYLDAPLGSLAGTNHSVGVHETYYTDTISPTAAYASTASYEPQAQVLDPRDAFQQPVLTSPSSLANALSPVGSEYRFPAAVDAMTERAMSDEPYQATYQPVAYTSPSSDETGSSTDSDTQMDEDYVSDSGSEYNDDADDDYGARPRSKVARRMRASALHTPEPGTPVDEEFYASTYPTRQARPRAPPTRMALPQPIPNLTKKSRGRRVPTSSGLVMKGGVTKPERAYVCRIDGCGKCFARGEHLKRHVRSIHTNEKPFKCTHAGCDKSFSRHDNLGQHMRIHSSRRR